MSFRRIAASAAAILTLGAAAPATANASLLGQFDQAASQIISGADCSTLRTTLNLIDQGTEGELLTPATTRNQLAANLLALGNTNASLSPMSLAAIKYAGVTADRAKSCGIVKEDTLLTGGGSELSSKLSDVAPLLSSTLGLKK
ncbi:hypothetical protein [Corynebacterium sp.]|uniref:hypothetical protein n=1 Tax=Corynebacterium sp. TaxID=1720 RepID=UPI0026DDBBC7|nr:hypothetical protein [Corynebacterium sp.]MDO5032834.1 hypothetical protein [Corynebacterium sp.]